MFGVIIVQEGNYNMLFKTNTILVNTMLYYIHKLLRSVYSMKEIVGYDYRYFVDDKGAMFRESKTGKLFTLKSYHKKSHNTTYEAVILVKDGKQRERKVHRLLLAAYNPVDNMDELQVDHINQDSLDNRLDNLRWCTDLENQYNRPKHMQPKPVLFINKLNNERLEFHSLSQAAREFSTTVRVVKNAIEGRGIKFKDWDVSLIV